MKTETICLGIFNDHPPMKIIFLHEDYTYLQTICMANSKILASDNLFHVEQISIQVKNARTYII